MIKDVIVLVDGLHTGGDGFYDLLPTPAYAAAVLYDGQPLPLFFNPKSPPLPFPLPIWVEELISSYEAPWLHVGAALGGGFALSVFHRWGLHEEAQYASIQEAYYRRFGVDENLRTSTLFHDSNKEHNEQQ